jgi:hypothetical protein
MFGNTKGWGISGLIVVVVGALIYFMGRPPQITPPTKTIPLALSSISDSMKDADPAKLDIKPAGTDADAHDLYVNIIDDYKKNRFRYEKYSDISKLAVDKPEFLQWLVDAADCNKATLFGKKPELLINYENEQDSLVALKETGSMANRLGLYLVAGAIQKGKEVPAAADKYLKAAFLLGERLFYERLRFEELTTGNALMADAALGLEREATAKHDDARAAQLDAFATAIRGYDSKIIPVWQALSGIGGNPLNNAGDMFDVAANSKEPMWRIEAILKLGRMHYMDTVTPADQRGAVRVLKQLAENGDPYAVRVAAGKARDLKVEDFRKIGGGS